MELCPQPGNISPDYFAAKLAYKLLSYRFESQLERSKTDFRYEMRDGS
jgi:hypothetical protein